MPHSVRLLALRSARWTTTTSSGAPPPTAAGPPTCSPGWPPSSGARRACAPAGRSASSPVTCSCRWRSSIPGFLLTLVRARGSADRAVDVVSRKLAQRDPGRDRGDAAGEGGHAGSGRPASARWAPCPTAASTCATPRARSGSDVTAPLDDWRIVLDFLVSRAAPPRVRARGPADGLTLPRDGPGVAVGRWPRGGGTERGAGAGDHRAARGAGRPRRRGRCPCCGRALG